jgi:transaldolase
MPPETIRAFQDHGQVEPSLLRDVDDARRTFETIADAAVAVDYADVVNVCEREGVEKFAASFPELIDNIAIKREALAAV